MATTWIRVRDTRTGLILPNQVPLSFLEKFDYLQETPQSRNARQAKMATLQEPIQPAQQTPETTEITEPDVKSTPAKSGRTTTTGK